MVYEHVWVSFAYSLFCMIQFCNIEKKADGRGFTLIELLVVISIVAVISTIVLANNNLFKGTTVLQNLGYDIAITVRQAQVYGISVVRTSGGRFDVGYGMHFVAGGVSGTQYRMFSDSTTRNGIYDIGEDVPPSPFSITGGYAITKICVPAGTDAATCTAVSSMDVFFVRPEPDAYITKNSETLTFDSANAVVGSSPNANARVVVSSPGGVQTISVIIDQNGQISVTRI
jgi:prepilin-type N-terminal cleavage/methylation domain-containing protein